MAKANLIGPLFMNGGSSLSDRVLDILSNNHHLTAKQIYYLVRSKFGTSQSYQAIHKTLHNLVKMKVLKKDKNLYWINQEWLDLLDDFAGRARETMKRRNTRDIGVQLKKTKKKIKVISFDMDGCLSDNNFDDIFWDREIPKLVAELKKISFEDAYRYVVHEYERLWGKTDDWRNPNFWLNHFGINKSWEEIMANFKKEIKHYGDSAPVLKNLQKEYTVVITSHADRNFLDLKLKIDSLGRYFDYTFSTPSDFNSMKKSTDVYKKICNMLGIKPHEMVHIGDHYEFDYVVPMSIGIRSFLIDRSGKLREDYVVRNLYAFETKIKELS